MTADGGSDGLGVSVGTGVAGTGEGDAGVPGVTSGAPVALALGLTRGEAVAPSVAALERIGDGTVPVAWLVAVAAEGGGGTGVDAHAATITSATAHASER